MRSRISETLSSPPCRHRGLEQRLGRSPRHRDRAAPRSPPGPAGRSGRRCRSGSARRHASGSLRTCGSIRAPGRIRSVAAQDLGDDRARVDRGAAVGQLGAWRVVGAELHQRAVLDPVDPAVADVEHQAPVPARPPIPATVVPMPYQAGRSPISSNRASLALCSSAAIAASSVACAAREARCSATIRLATSPAAWPPMPSATRQISRGRDLALQHDRRRHRLAGDPVADRDRVLVAGAHGALMGECGHAQTDRRRHGSPDSHGAWTPA